MKVLAGLILAILFLNPLAYAKFGGGDISFEVKEAGNVVFSHVRHNAGEELGCTQCHDALYVTQAKHVKATMAQMEKGASCGACHNGTRAFDVKTDCQKCHKK